MYDREIKRKRTIQIPYCHQCIQGMASLTIQTLIQSCFRFYQFAMYTENGVEQIIYTDTYDNAKGVIEVIDDVYPEFEPSQVCENFFNDGTYFISTAFNGCVKHQNLSQFTPLLCILITLQAQLRYKVT